MFFRRSESFRQTTRLEALAELTREADEVFRRQAQGLLTLEQAEQELEKLSSRYETPFDRFLAAS